MIQGEALNTCRREAFPSCKPAKDKLRIALLPLRKRGGADRGGPSVCPPPFSLAHGENQPASERVWGRGKQPREEYWFSGYQLSLATRRGCQGRLECNRPFCLEDTGRGQAGPFAPFPQQPAEKNADALDLCSLCPNLAGCWSLRHKVTNLPESPPAPISG